MTQARTELALIGRTLAQQYPDSNAGARSSCDPMRPNVGDVRGTLWLLLGAVSLVLLIACANVGELAAGAGGVARAGTGDAGGAWERVADGWCASA